MDPSTSGAHAPASYASYWIAWGVLLGITLVMLALAHPTVLLIGIALKAGIICWWFMHLKSERWDLTLTVVLGAFVTALILFGLIAPDGVAM
jgi:caa(3)-type oxidase subunit IV